MRKVAMNYSDLFCDGSPPTLSKKWLQEVKSPKPHSKHKIKKVSFKRAQGKYRHWDNLLLVRDIIICYRLRILNVQLFNIDQGKFFDSHRFEPRLLFKIFEGFGFGRTFLSWIKLCSKTGVLLKLGKGLSWPVEILWDIPFFGQWACLDYKRSFRTNFFWKYYHQTQSASIPWWHHHFLNKWMWKSHWRPVEEIPQFIWIHILFLHLPVTLFLYGFMKICQFMIVSVIYSDLKLWHKCSREIKAPSLCLQRCHISGWWFYFLWREFVEEKKTEDEGKMLD